MKESQDALAIKCWATVANMFAMFHNQKTRGPAFTWDRFDGTHEAKLITAMMDDLDEEHRWFVVDLCMQIASQLKKEAGYTGGVQ